MASGSDRDLRRRFNRDPTDPLPDNSAVSFNPPSLPPLRGTLTGSRVRVPMTTSAAPGSRPSRYQPANRRTLASYRSNFDASAVNSSLQDLDRSLEDTHSHLRALLQDFTDNRLMPPCPPVATSPLLHGQDGTEEAPRIKRRKLDSDRTRSIFKGFRYGRYGEVEPGPLTMEIVSCDGGLYSDEPSYPPENILKNDVSVYCTKGNRCNIILRHQGGTVFSLRELIIKAPESKFTCPYVPPV